MFYLVNYNQHQVITNQVDLLPQLLKRKNVKVTSFTDKKQIKNYQNFQVVNQKAEFYQQLGIILPKKAKKKTKPKPNQHLIKDGTNVHRFDYYVYTDGGHRYKSDTGAWAYAVYDHEYQEIHNDSAGNFTGSTNNTMEITALIRALQYLDQINANDQKILITSDSKYLINSVTKWLVGWQKKGWKRSGGKLKNVGLWQQLYQLIPLFSTLYIRWTKGHDHNHGNIEADHLLNNTMDSMRRY